MKILMLAAAGNIHTIRWSNELSRLGHEVVIVTEKGQENFAHKIDNNIKQYVLKFSGKIGYYLNALELKKLLKKIKPDVINVHCASGYGTLCRIARIHPVVLNVWGSDVFNFPSNFIKKRIIIKNLKYANALASTSYGMADRVKELLNNDQVNVTIVPFGVDTEKFVPMQKNNDKKCFVFGCIKAYTYNYGIDQLIKAFKLVLDKWETLDLKERKPQLVLYGRGVDKNDFIKLSKELNIYDDIIFNDFIANEDVPKALAQFDVSCFPSIEESFGVSAVESMACAVPVIASKTVGFSEVIEDNVSGLLFEINDVNKLAELMWYVYTNQDIISELGKASRERVLELYDRRENVKTLEYILKKNMKKD